MGRDTELFKAAQNGNIEYLEKVFAAYLAKDKDTPHRGGRVKKHSGLRSVLIKGVYSVIWMDNCHANPKWWPVLNISVISQCSWNVRSTVTPSNRLYMVVMIWS